MDAMRAYNHRQFPAIESCRGYRGRRSRCGHGEVRGVEMGRGVEGGGGRVVIYQPHKACIRLKQLRKGCGWGGPDKAGGGGDPDKSEYSIFKQRTYSIHL